MEPTVNVRLPTALWAEVLAESQRQRRSGTAQLAIVVERGLGKEVAPTFAPTDQKVAA